MSLGIVEVHVTYTKGPPLDITVIVIIIIIIIIIILITTIAILKSQLPKEPLTFELPMAFRFIFRYFLLPILTCLYAL